MSHAYTKIIQLMNTFKLHFGHFLECGKLCVIPKLKSSQILMSNAYTKIIQLLKTLDIFRVWKIMHNLKYTGAWH